MSVWHIAVREWRSVFTTPIGWMVLCGVLLVTGTFWWVMVEGYVQAQNDLVFNPTAAAVLSLTDHLIVPWFDTANVILMMVMPALSMGLFAGEFQRKTWELLSTSPVSNAQIVLGKFLGVWAVVGVLLLLMLNGPFLLYLWATPDLAVLMCGWLSLMLVSGSLLSFGMLMSSFTESQLIALVLSFSLSLTILALGYSGGGPDSWAVKLTMLSHVQDLWRGVIRVSDLVYFGAFIGTFLFATHQRLESL